MIRLLFLMSLLFPAIASAQTNDLPPECRVLPEHHAADGVAYQPGVNVHGKPVVPADINSSPIGQQETMVVPLSIELASRLEGMNIPGIGMDGLLGFLEISPDGRVTYNGQDLTSQVYVLCDQTAMPEPAADRQIAPDVIESVPLEDVKGPPPKPVQAPPAPDAQTVKPAPRKEEPKGELLQGGDYRD